MRSAFTNRLDRRFTSTGSQQLGAFGLHAAPDKKLAGGGWRASASRHRRACPSMPAHRCPLVNAGSLTKLALTSWHRRAHGLAREYKDQLVAKYGVDRHYLGSGGASKRAACLHVCARGLRVARASARGVSPAFLLVLPFHPPISAGQPPGHDQLARKCRTQVRNRNS